MPTAHDPSTLTDPTLADVLAAQSRLRGLIRRTPLWQLDLEGPGGYPVYAKPENLQLTGSFKIRGALNFLSNLTAEQRQLGVVAHSSGNHAQGVAAAARHFGVKATIVIPEGAPEVKVASTRALGAEIVRCANSQDAREETTRQIGEKTGATPVPPFDHPWIVAGQGTLGAEIVEDLPDVANVLAPVGGGGLISGVAVAVRSLSQAAQVIGVEPELAADAFDSLTTGERKRWSAEQTTRTMADGVRTQCIGEVNFRLMSALLGGVVRVEERRLPSAVAWYAKSAKLVVEPTGGLSLAALHRLLEEGGSDGVKLAPGPTVLVVSGGNIEPSMLARMVSE